ncbi:hypothetical protein PV325_011565 [Microctonus aethiopoides]|nr:hypothetical protein PV325_011565 [Microctonus aethiopoides]
MCGENILKLCCRTLNQSQCQEWDQARRSRLSASSNIHSIKVQIRKTIDNHENKAKEKYEYIYGCEVKKVGVIVSKQQPWLCASVVIEDGCIVRIVGFKCPIKCKNQPVVD